MPPKKNVLVKGLAVCGWEGREKESEVDDEVRKLQALVAGLHLLRSQRRSVESSEEDLLCCRQVP